MAKHSCDLIFFIVLVHCRVLFQVINLVSDSPEAVFLSCGIIQNILRFIKNILTNSQYSFRMQYIIVTDIIET